MERKDFIHNPDGQEKGGFDPIKALENQYLSLLGKYEPELTFSVLNPEKIISIKETLTGHLIEVASDLAANGLAEGHVSRLIDHLVKSGAKTEFDLFKDGGQEFINIAENVYGPLWASYVDLVFQTLKEGDSVLFAARDATPMHWTAEGLISQLNGYRLEGVNIVHSDWNRWFMGQEDETEDGKKPLDLNHPLMQKFYEQLGFGKGNLVKIIEPGAWGSAANALKLTRPGQDFELWFMFSHMPKRIFGFLNENAPGFAEDCFELINDSQESLPKAYKRPEDLVEVNGAVVADISDKIIDSPYMQLWPLAVNIGAAYAGIDFMKGKKIDVCDHVSKITVLSEQSKQGIWTGALPDHTPTWSNGEKWVKKWPWGKIPPLK